MKRFAKWGLIVAVVLCGLWLFARVAGLGAKNKAGGASAGLSFNVGKTETHNNISSSSTTAASEHAGFNCRRVLLIQTQPDRLSARIAALVSQQLTNDSQIEQVEWVKPPATFSQGAQAPDLFIRIGSVRLEENGILSRSLKATFDGSIGDRPWESSRYVHDSGTPPLVQFTWNTLVENNSIFKGIRSDRYGDTVGSIADEFVKGISNQLETLSAKYPALPEWPRAFYGPYEPINDFDFLKEVKGLRACSYYGMFTHNETFWEFQTATNPAPQLERIIGQLESAQWKFGYASLTNTQDYYASLQKGKATLEIFRADRNRLSSLSGKTEDFIGFVAHYRKPFSAAEREAALETLFSGQPSVESLLPFQNVFSGAQRERFYALMEKTPATTPATGLSLAERRLNRKETNAAVNLLVQAKALAIAGNDPTAVLSNVESMAKRISPKQDLKLEVTPEVCRELGFLELTNATQTLELEREPGQPILWFGQGERGLTVLALVIQPPRHGVYQWKFSQARDGIESTTSSSFNLAEEKTWRNTFSFNQQRIKVAAHLGTDGRRLVFNIEPER